MNKNIYSFKDFQKSKVSILKESIIPFEDHYKVRNNVDVPFSLVNAYVKKIKEDSGQDIKQYYSDMEIAEEIAKYISTSFMNIENIPADILIPEKQTSPIQGQGQIQSQEPLDLDLGGESQVPQGQAQVPQGQDQVPQGQAQKPQGQIQGQQVQRPQGQTQGQRQSQTQGQRPQVQKTAAQIPPQETI